MTWDDDVELDSWERSAAEQLRRHYRRQPRASVVQSHLADLQRVALALGSAPAGPAAARPHRAARTAIMVVAAAVILVGAYFLATLPGQRTTAPGPAGPAVTASTVDTSTGTVAPDDDGVQGGAQPGDDPSNAGDDDGSTDRGEPASSSTDSSPGTAGPATSTTSPASPTVTTRPPGSSPTTTAAPGSSSSAPPATGTQTTGSSGETCAGLTATIVGTSQADVLVGSAGADVIVGGSGDDVIYGLDGDDVICGGNGADELFGGDGADQLFGGNGTDELHGGDGADTLVGGHGPDVLDGTPGVDTLIQDEP